MSIYNLDKIREATNSHLHKQRKCAVATVDISDADGPMFRMTGHLRWNQEYSDTSTMKWDLGRGRILTLVMKWADIKEPIDET